MVSHPSLLASDVTPQPRAGVLSAVAERLRSVISLEASQGNTLAPSGAPVVDGEAEEGARGGEEDAVLPPATVAGLLAAADARFEVIQTIIADTDRTLGEFRRRRAELATAVREVLAKTASLRRADFDRLLTGVLTHQERREQDVQQVLAAFREEEEATTGHFRRLLTRAGGVRVKEFKRALRDIHREQDERLRATTEDVERKFRRLGAEVQTMLEGLRVERERVSVEDGGKERG